jgi:hypothetical protein
MCASGRGGWGIPFFHSRAWIHGSRLLLLASISGRRGSVLVGAPRSGRYFRFLFGLIFFVFRQGPAGRPRLGSARLHSSHSWSFDGERSREPGGPSHHDPITRLRRRGPPPLRRRQNRGRRNFALGIFLFCDLGTEASDVRRTHGTPAHSFGRGSGSEVFHATRRGGDGSPSSALPPSSYPLPARTALARGPLTPPAARAVVRRGGPCVSGVGAGIVPARRRAPPPGPCSARASRPVCFYYVVSARCAAARPCAYCFGSAARQPPHSPNARRANLGLLLGNIFYLTLCRPGYRPALSGPPSRRRKAHAGLAGSSYSARSWMRCARLEVPAARPGSPGPGRSRPTRVLRPPLPLPVLAPRPAAGAGPRGAGIEVRMAEIGGTTRIFVHERRCCATFHVQRPFERAPRAARRAPRAGSRARPRLLGSPLATSGLGGITSRGGRRFRFWLLLPPQHPPQQLVRGKHYCPGVPRPPSDLLDWRRRSPPLPRPPSVTRTPPR